MVLLNLLHDEIKSSGVTKQFIARKLGITTQCLSKKLKGESGFKVDEARALSEVLHLTDARRDAIFFAPSSDF